MNPTLPCALIGVSYEDNGEDTEESCRYAENKLAINRRNPAHKLGTTMMFGLMLVAELGTTREEDFGPCQCQALFGSYACALPYDNVGRWFRMEAGAE